MVALPGAGLAIAPMVASPVAVRIKAEVLASATAVAVAHCTAEASSPEVFFASLQLTHNSNHSVINSVFFVSLMQHKIFLNSV